MEILASDASAVAGFFGLIAEVLTEVAGHVAGPSEQIDSVDCE